MLDCYPIFLGWNLSIQVIEFVRMQLKNWKYFSCGIVTPQTPIVYDYKATEGKAVFTT